MLTYHTFYPGGKNLPQDAAAGAALDALMAGESPEQTYSRMIRYRLSGKAFSECRDVYFIALDGEMCVSRVWYGWGKHCDAIGNFGNFRTAEDHQKQGIGRILLKRCFDELSTAHDSPLALFCTAGEYIAPVYRKYGFRPILPGRISGPLFSPCSGSAEDFDEFCRRYYHPATELIFLPGDIGYRHEIDLLFKFYCVRNGLDFGLPSFSSYEHAFLAVSQEPSIGILERIAINDGHTVGWAFTPDNGKRQIHLHPNYKYLYH